MGGLDSGPTENRGVEMRSTSILLYAALRNNRYAPVDSVPRTTRAAQLTLTRVDMQRREEDLGICIVYSARCPACETRCLVACDMT